MPPLRCLIPAAITSAITAFGQPAPSFSETVPFTAGQGGYHTYRIPAIVRSTNGTLLAFCEGRKNSTSDSGDIDIVLRRSTNNGVTWLAQTIVQEEGGNSTITIGNPAPVVDWLTGHIHLLFCRNNDRVFHTVSTNDGISWSVRTEITSAVKLAHWGWYATGPGHGIQLQRGAQAGRLVVPCDFNTTNGVNGAHVIHSDNHGATWQLGAINSASGGVNPNETMCEELVATSAGGGARIYFNTRDQGGVAPGTRGEAWSGDGGSSFTGAFTNRASFVCPVVQGSLLRVHATDVGAISNRILFACPNDANTRTLMSIWSSADEALSWSAPKIVYDGPSAYSDMTLTAAGEVALLFEKGSISPYEMITLARFNEAWLDSPATASENPQSAFWNFEEKLSGQTASTNIGEILDIDPTNGGNHLTSQKAFAYLAGSTNYGNGVGLAFDGTGGLQISDAATENHFDYGATNSFTIEAVFRIPAGSTQTGSLVAKDYGPLLPSWWLRVQGGFLRFLVCDGAVEVIASGSMPVNNGLWHHVAAVRDTRIPGTKLLRLYLDGLLLTNVVDTTTGSLANNQPLNVGRFGNSATRNLTGDIDQVRVTPRALAPGEFLKRWTQFDADADMIPDTFERTAYGSLGVLGDDDTDVDGSADVAEFGFGTDALSSNSIPRIAAVINPGTLVITAYQRTLPPWLEMQLETSALFVNWSPAPGVVSLTPLGDGRFERKQVIGDPAALSEKQFFRLRLSPLH